jgi:hypothetical protein
MKELSTVKFLRSYENTSDAIQTLKDKYFIKVNAHSKYPNLLQFKYDQLDSPMKEELVQECRGLILDSEDNWKVIAYPFNKFFSNGEFHAAKIDWDTAKFFDKIDGSMMFMYYYRGEWHVASSGLPDARGLTLDKKTTFAELFWSIWDENKYEFESQNHTYIFELTSPITQVLVPQSKNKIQLIGARNLDTLQETYIELVGCNWPKVKWFDVSSLEEAQKLCMKMNPVEREGFVIRDAEFNRVKLKSPQYVALSHLGLTLEEIKDLGLDQGKYDKKTQEKWILKIIQINECDEFLNYHPQYKSMYYDTRNDMMISLAILVHCMRKSKIFLFKLTSLKS